MSSGTSAMKASRKLNCKHLDPIMQKWQMRPSLASRLPHSTCCRTFFTSNSPSLRADETASRRPPPPRQARQVNSRQASAKASRDVQGLRQGLRGMAPAGFARPPPLELASAARTRGEKQPPVRTRTPRVRRRDNDPVPMEEDEAAYEEAVDLSQVDPAKLEELRELLRQVQSSGDDHVANKAGEQNFGFVEGEEEVRAAGGEGQGEGRGEDQLDGAPQKELEMIEAIESHFAKPQIRYAPKEYRPEELVNNRTATIAGLLGPQSEIDEATGRLARRDDTRWVSDAAMARQLMAGRLVKFADAREKQRIVALAELMSRETAQKLANKILRKKQGDQEMDENFDLTSLVETRKVGFVPVGSKVREDITNKVTRGRYESLGPCEGKGLKEQTMAHLAQSVQLNGSYTPTAGKSMLEFIEKLWPSEAAQTGPRK